MRKSVMFFLGAAAIGNESVDASGFKTMSTAELRNLRKAVQAASSGNPASSSAGTRSDAQPQIVPLTRANLAAQDALNARAPTASVSSASGSTANRYLGKFVLESEIEKAAELSKLCLTLEKIDNEFSPPAENDAEGKLLPPPKGSFAAAVAKFVEDLKALNSDLKALDQHKSAPVKRDWLMRVIPKPEPNVDIPSCQQRMNTLQETAGTLKSQSIDLVLKAYNDEVRSFKAAVGSAWKPIENFEVSTDFTSGSQKELDGKIVKMSKFSRSVYRFYSAQRDASWLGGSFNQNVKLCQKTAKRVHEIVRSLNGFTKQ